MSKIDNLTDKALEFAGKISENQVLLCLRDGFMAAFPATMFASICLIVMNLPVTFGFDQMIPQGIVDFLYDFFGPITNATMACSSLFAVFGIAYFWAKHKKANPLFAGIVALASFLMLIPFGSTEMGTHIPLSKLGSEGTLVAILTAFLATSVYAWLENKHITIKMPPQVPQGIANSFTAIIPGAAALLVMNCVRYAFAFTPYGNAFDFLYQSLQAPLLGLGGSLGATIVAVILIQIFWWFGVHGQSLVGTITEPIWGTLALENMTAYNAGLPLPNIICTTFMGVFPLMGGNGMTLGIILLSLFIARSARLKETMKMCAVPSFFNISEPITFGLPVVMNPMILIPWILAPVVTVLISYFAIDLGFVPRPTGVTVIYTTPFFLSGWLATGSIAGGLLQIVNLVVSTLIYLPFMMTIDKSYLKEEKADALAEEASVQTMSMEPSEQGV